MTTYKDSTATIVIASVPQQEAAHEIDVDFGENVHAKGTDRTMHGNLVYDMVEEELVSGLLPDPEVYEAARCIDEERWFYRFVKRTFDILFSLAVLVLFCWLFAIIAIAIKIDDPKGPVIFKLERVGKNGEPFMMWKFRSMYCGAESRLDELMMLNEKTGPVFKMARDPRIDSRIIETNTRRPLSALVFASVFPPKNTVVSPMFPQVNVQISHSAEMVGNFLPKQGAKLLNSPKNLQNVFSPFQRA